MSFAQRLMALVAQYESTAPALKSTVAVAWAILIFGASAVQLPGVPRSFLISYCHNATHIAAFGMLSLLVFLALPGRGPGRVAWAILLSLAYGISDEWHQSFVPGRTASIYDVGSDFVGACWALMVLAWLRQPDWRRGLICLGFIPLAGSAAWLATIY